MKPGMQRDILVAFWLLFDEFEIGDADPPQTPNAPSEPNTASPATDASPHPGRTRPNS